MKEIIKVEPLKDYKLLLTFDNNEKRIKDILKEFIKEVEKRENKEK